MKTRNRKAATKPAAPDAALKRLGVQFNQPIEEAYSHWKILSRLKAPFYRRLDRLGYQQPARQEAWAAFERTAVGRRADREYKAFCKACTPCHRTARAIMQKRPQTVAGAAVFAIAALYDGEWAGFGFSVDDASGRIVTALSEAAKIKLPNGIRQAVLS